MNRLLRQASSLIFSGFVLIFFATGCEPGPADGTSMEGVAPKEAINPEEAFGELFHDVQMAGIFEDSKTFVDCRPQADPELILKAYQEMKGKPDFDLESFVQQNFLPPRQLSSDFQSDEERTIDEHIIALWPSLTRQPDEDISGSLIELPHSYVVPGGRFREIYYWDSYFTMQGLLVSPPESRVLIGEMLANFGYLIDTLGFIPNGNRTYFRSRSQPPFFSLMVELWNGQEPGTLVNYLPQLEKEYAFWMEGEAGLEGPGSAHRRVVRLTDGTVMNRYWDDIPEPRPESYREDVELAQRVERPREELFRDLRAACESGWDFSSRWLKDPYDLGTIHTSEIIPVDLNCLVFHLEKMLAEAYGEKGDQEKAEEMEGRATRRANAIERYCWSSQGYYSDYDWVEGNTTDIITAAMVYPLFFEVASKEHAEQVDAAIREHLLADGGVLTTKVESGQQWDAPNGWAPLQWMSYQGLNNYDFTETAGQIRSRWIALNTRVYANTGRMVEKYNVSDMTLEAGGGEYALQDGFGWSNGVLLGLMKDE